jgi:uncharacterized protein DUF1554/chitobiase/beta-hexosaminidase-like protein
MKIVNHCTFKCLLLIAGLVLLITGCGDNKENSSDKEIATFSFDASDNAALTITVSCSISGTLINCIVPDETTVTALVAKISHTGTNIDVGGVEQVSAVTPNDFTNPVTYTVTASDATAQNYIVTTVSAPTDSKAITAFRFLAENNPDLSADVDSTIDESADTINLSVLASTAVTALVPSINITGSSVSPGSEEATDFSSAATYTVTAADASTQDYAVTVTIATASNPARSVTFTPAAGSYNSDVNISISTTTTGATIYYTTDGSNPDIFSDEYNTPISVAGHGTTMTIKSYAVKSGFVDSMVESASYTITDNTSPMPGNSGTIATSSVTSTSLTLDWTKAADDYTAETALTYRVFHSTTDNINTVADAEANGTETGSESADIDTKDVSGLTASTTYYFAVVVKDEALNKSIYTLTYATPAPPGDYIYVTASTYDGNLGGTTGADAKCMSDANYPGSGTYKALLGTGTTLTRISSAGDGASASETDWVLQPSTTYTRLDSTVIGTTTPASLFTFNLSNAFTATGGVTSWSGLAPGWEAYSGADCVGWTTNSVSDIGGSGSSDALGSTAIASNPSAACNNLYSLVCVSQ